MHNAHRYFIQEMIGSIQNSQSRGIEAERETPFRNISMMRKMDVQSLTSPVLDKTKDGLNAAVEMLSTDSFDIKNNTVIDCLIIFLVLLLLWRIITFTVLPIFQPNDPKLYPYWIPGKINCKLDSS